ncbi:MAG: hypothetical protein IIA61_04870 [Candidatus Marinimicrobia bacterium]|nr:hypothetical protein [Candidatus Neomarinimicrobiota bacterium]
MQIWADSFFHVDDMTLMLPKFTFEYEIELNDIPKQLGVEIAFDSRTDISNMVQNEPLCLNNNGEISGERSELTVFSVPLNKVMG